MLERSGGWETVGAKVYTGYLRKDKDHKG